MARPILGTIGKLPKAFWSGFGKFVKSFDKFFLWGFCSQFLTFNFLNARSFFLSWSFFNYMNILKNCEFSPSNMWTFSNPHFFQICDIFLKIMKIFQNRGKRHFFKFMIFLQTRKLFLKFAYFFQNPWTFSKGQRSSQRPLYFKIYDFLDPYFFWNERGCPPAPTFYWKSKGNQSTLLTALGSSQK